MTVMIIIFPGAGGDGRALRTEARFQGSMVSASRRVAFPHSGDRPPILEPSRLSSWVRCSAHHGACSARRAASKRTMSPSERGSNTTRRVRRSSIYFLRAKLFLQINARGWVRPLANSAGRHIALKSRTTLSAPIPAMAPFAFVGRVCRRAALPCLFRRRILPVGTGLDGSSLTSRGERTEVKRPAAANKLLADRWHRLHCQAPRY